MVNMKTMRVVKDILKKLAKSKVKVMTKVKIDGYSIQLMYMFIFCFVANGSFCHKI